MYTVEISLFYIVSLQPTYLPVHSWYTELNVSLLLVCNVLILQQIR